MDPTKLFDFIKIMFTDKTAYENVSNNDKRRHFFMLNRFWSIKYPETAQAFNHLKINQANAIDMWFRLSAQFNRVPGWFYTRTKKSKSNIAKKKLQYSKEAKDMYLQMNNIDSKTLAELEKYYPAELEKELKTIDSQIDFISIDKK